MTTDKIEDKTSISRDLWALVFIVGGVSILTTGLYMLGGWGAVLAFWGLVMTGLGVTMGVSRTGKG